jgi:hypothetical protein
MGYKMVVDYEKLHNFRYDWIVHGRLDLAWVAAIEPISHFTPLRVWVPATWQEWCPDTFALVPRRHADAFFMLSRKIIPDPEKLIFCLGGPDFDDRYCNSTYLEDELKMNETHVSNITSLCCPHETLSHSESIQKAVLYWNKIIAEPAPFHFFIARATDVGEFCDQSLEASRAWRVVNYKDDIKKGVNLSYWARSIGPIVGCHEFVLHCTVQKGAVQAETHDGMITTTGVTGFDCPATADTRVNFREWCS